MHSYPRIDKERVKSIAEGLVPELSSRAFQAEKDRRVPPENIKLLHDSGLLGIFRSRKWGGSELSMRAHVDAVATIAKGCGATAWVLGVYHAHDYIIGHMSEKAQEEIYTTGDITAVAAVIGPRGKAVRKADGSYILNGFWPFASGNSASHWLLLGAEVFDEAGNKLDEGDLAVPAEDVERLDDWHVAGLQGTGSNSVKCTDVVVPAHRFVSLPAILENQTPVFASSEAPAIYKCQGGPALGMFIATSALGAARRSLEEFRKVVPGKKVMYTSHVSHEWSALQVALGEAASMIHQAELVFYRAADDVDDYARRGEKMPMETRGRIRMDITVVPRLCRDAVQKLLTIGGASGLSLKSPIQLNFRNLQATSMHGFLLHDAGAEIFGRVLLGVDPGTGVI
ncbi:acyl-CoA dehydrogenase family protein [Rhizobium leguminosarum]|uniref:acyl-CoA dehydrogenase family protein n=1 Tax=Rhizobium leguminosarum TaxID=384 RepID=UPI001F46DE9D|nr:acyl-CoA dehydrogenase family protein [Rhizobium leguminosarum]UIJ84048.1 acyl-CoA dehydrogenase family protein [Rhizobium leguminosarum]